MICVESSLLEFAYLYFIVGDEAIGSCAINKPVQRAHSFLASL
jgi:hypothetical protein